MDLGGGGEGGGRGGVHTEHRRSWTTWSNGILADTVDQDTFCRVVAQLYRIFKIIPVTGSVKPSPILLYLYSIRSCSIFFLPNNHLFRRYWIIIVGIHCEIEFTCFNQQVHWFKPSGQLFSLYSIQIKYLRTCTSRDLVPSVLAFVHSSSWCGL